MRKTIFLSILIGFGVAFLVGCADERHVVTTPVPPAPPPQKLRSR